MIGEVRDAIMRAEARASAHYEQPDWIHTAGGPL
jgi:hypothetical protein